MPRNNPSTKWFVTRAIDGRILGRDGLWRKQFASVNDIKFYSTCGRATRYGFSKISEYRPTLGNMFEVGQARAVHQNETVDVCGRIHDQDGNWIR